MQKSKKRQDLEIDDACVWPQAQIPEHKQTTWEVALVRVGHGVRVVGGTEADFQAGDLVVIPPGVRHVWRFGADEVNAEGKVEDVCLRIDPKALHAALRRTGLLDDAAKRFLGRRTAVVLNGALRRHVRALVEDCLGANRALAMVRAVEIFHRVAHGEGMTILPNAEKAPHTKQDDLRVYVLCNFMRKLTLADAAAHMGMGKSLFCAFMRREMGMPFTRYVNTIRIEEACRQLATTGGTVTEVALNVGFSDLAYFNRVFKSVTGDSPSHWRRRFGRLKV